MADDKKIFEAIEAKHDGRAQVWLQKRQKEVAEITASISQGDYPSVAMMGGMIKKGAGNFGLAKIAEFGEALETAAKIKNSQKMKTLLADYADYVKRIELDFQ
jgi:hypothetical protein